MKFTCIEKFGRLLLLMAVTVTLTGSLSAIAADKNRLLNDCESAFKAKYGEESLVRLKRTKTYKGLTTLTFKVVPEGGSRTNMTCSSQSGDVVVIN
ncbi:MAG: Uncharacterised protein [Methanobacteriota archaeon]|nr:MAG: Uncharacterised protein [Euryarchaeota archaeon]